MQLPVSDRLFRHAFSTQQSARELAENFLPPAYRRRIAAARVLLEAMHREPLTPELREFFQSCYQAMAARKEAEEIAVLMEAAESYGYPDTREDLMTWEQEVKIKGKREGRREGRQEGISLGQLREKQDVLIRLLDRKFGISEAERELIRAVEDPVRLDAALDEILFAENKDAVLEKLGTRGCA